jgi:hypothetical protein
MKVVAADRHHIFSIIVRRKRWRWESAPIGGADGYEQSPLDPRRLEWHDRDDRFRHHAAGLAEPPDGVEPDALGQWPAWHGIEVADTLYAKARG